jgi:hypothetical protein
MDARKRATCIVVALGVLGAIVPNSRVVWAVVKTQPLPASPKNVTIGESQSISKPFVVWAASPALEERGRKALAMIAFDYAEAFPGWTISFRPARKRLLGVTLVSERRIEIYVRKNRPTDQVAHDIAHEFGHVVDVSYNNEASRAKYVSIRGIPAGTPWWACDSCRDSEVGAGDFAEVFAHLVAPRTAFYSQVKGSPSAKVAEDIRTQVIPRELRFHPVAVSPKDVPPKDVSPKDELTADVSTADVSTASANSEPGRIAPR